MKRGYYVDTSIWMDLLEGRIGYRGEKLGDYALRFFAFLKSTKRRLVVSDLLVFELKRNYSSENIIGFFLPYQDIIKRVFFSQKEYSEAKKLAKERNLPLGDALHSILARDHQLILVTRDKHFILLRDVCSSYKPEEII